MNDKEVAGFWEENAEAWTKLSRMGMDIPRDHLNTPAFLAMLPEVRGLKGLDIGCGEGHNTRVLAQLGAKMTGIDVSETFVRHARTKEEEEPLGIIYEVANAAKLGYPDRSFDFVAGFMSLMDMVNPWRAIEEACRVIKPGGFFQFSNLHPCFSTPADDWVKDDDEKIVARQIRNYFNEGFVEVEEWIFSQTPPELKKRLPKFKVPRFHFTFSSWMNHLINTGFVIECLHEPTASDELVKQHPSLAFTRVIAYYLVVRCRKPKG